MIISTVNAMRFMPPTSRKTTEEGAAVKGRGEFITATGLDVSSAPDARLKKTHRQEPDVTVKRRNFPYRVVPKRGDFLIVLTSAKR